MKAVRDRARNVRNRWFDQTLAQVERARVALERDAGDILLLGDSSCLSIAEGDTDRRLLPELIADRTGSSVIAVAGPGFDSRMFDGVLRVLSFFPQRPRAVVMAVNIRTNTFFHVTDHPVYSHHRSREALARVEPSVRRVRAFGRGGGAWREEELAEFRRHHVTTRWGGTQTIGEHVSRLEGWGPPPWPEEVEKGRYDYFHGPFVERDHPGLQSLAALGKRLAEYGVPAVGYWSQPPLAHGERLFPGAFADHVRSNFDLIEGAVLGESSGLARVIKPTLEDADFQDVRNATEHFSQTGRAKIVDAVAEALERITR